MKSKEHTDSLSQAADGTPVSLPEMLPEDRTQTLSPPHQTPKVIDCADILSDSPDINTPSTRSPPTVPGVPKENLKLWLQFDDPTSQQKPSRSDSSRLAVPCIETSQTSLDVETESTPKVSHSSKRQKSNFQLSDSQSSPQLSSSSLIEPPLFPRKFTNIVSGGPLESLSGNLLPDIPDYGDEQHDLNSSRQRPDNISSPRSKSGSTVRFTDEVQSLPEIPLSQTNSFGHQETRGEGDQASLEHTSLDAQNTFTKDETTCAQSEKDGKKVNGGNMFFRFWNSCPHINRPSWSRVSSAVVRNAPCFICCGSLDFNATDRMILTRLNMLCAFFALAQVAVGIFLLIVLLSPAVVARQLEDVEEKYGYYKEALTVNLWTPSGSCLILSVVGALVFGAMLTSIPVIRQVNLQGAIRYMWVLYWLLPLQILFVIALFDYHSVTDVWIKYWWSGPSMAWFRMIFCEDGTGTSNEECAVPINGGRDFATEDDWCLQHFNSTSCSDIRKDAVQNMSTVSYFFFYANAVGGLVLVVLLLLALSMLENIISVPIVTSSQEQNIPLWLTIPVTLSILGGYALLFSSQSVFTESSSTMSIYWIGIFYMVSAAFFTVSALLGWFISSKTVLNTRDKAQKQIAVYVFIGMVILTIFAVGAIFIASLIYSVSLVDIGFTDNQRGSIACYVDAVDSCSNCNETITTLQEKSGCNQTEIGFLGEKEIPSDDCRICPEWGKGDVVTIMQTQMKQSATLASIFLIFALRSLRFGFVLRSALARYEIDYV